MNLGVVSNSSGEFKQGSYVAFYCENESTNDMILLVAECMSDGEWNPDPHTLECDHDALQEGSMLQMNYMYSIIVHVQLQKF